MSKKRNKLREDKKAKIFCRWSPRACLAWHVVLCVVSVSTGMHCKNPIKESKPRVYIIIVAIVIIKPQKK